MAIAPPPSTNEISGAPPARSAQASSTGGETYWGLVWRQFLHNRIAVVSAILILFLFAIAIGAPFLANDMPIVFRGDYKSGYQDKFEEWQLGGHPEFMAQLQAMESAPASRGAVATLQERLATVEMELGRLAGQLPAGQARLLRGYETAYAKAVPAIGQQARQQSVAELQANFQQISTQFAPSKVTLQQKLYWPVISSLEARDIFFITLAVLALLLPVFRRLFPGEWTGSVGWQLLLVAAPAVLFAFLWMLPSLRTSDSFPYVSLKPPVFDTYNYKEQLYDGEMQSSFALFPPVQYGINEDHLQDKYTAPSSRYWLGTDGNGRDLLTRMIWGSRISLSVGFVAVAIYVSIGITVGMIAGYFRGWVDMLISRIIEVVICFPAFFLILAVLAFLQPSMWNIMVVIGITGWTEEARLVRGEFFRLDDQEFVLAAKGLGVSDRRIILRHILPNGLAPLLVSASFGVASAILIESSLSFLGFGISIPIPSWGGILNEARESFQYWWITIFPGLAIFATVTAYNLVGEGIRDAIDPRLKL